MCELAKVSRATYYRDWTRAEPVEAEIELRAEIQRVCLGHRRYGYRRVAQALRP